MKSNLQDIFALFLLFPFKKVLDPGSRTYCFVTAFRRLQQHEDDLQSRIRHIHETLLPKLYHKHQRKRSNDSPNYPKRETLYQTVAGSVAEGSSLTRMFAEKGFSLSFEVDIEQTMFQIPARLSHVVEDDKKKRGYLRMQTLDSTRCFECIASFFKEKFSRSMFDRRESQKRYITPYHVKSRHVGNKSTVAKCQELGTKMFLSHLFKTPLNEIQMELNKTTTKATNKRVLLVNISQSLPSMKLEFEKAFLVRLQWQTNFTRTWAQRQRNWPHIENLRQELNTGYVITKTSNQQKDNHNTKEMRYSFGHLERKLSRLRSRHQQLVYLIFKSMFYKHLYPVNQEHMTSYLAKTTMFWECEHSPPDHYRWRNDQNSIIKVLKYLFQRMLRSFENYTLPYFFIPEINLLKEIPSHVVKKAIVVLKFIVHDTVAFIPTNTDEVLNKSQFISEMILGAQELGEAVLRSDTSILLEFLSTLKSTIIMNKKSFKTILIDCFCKHQRSKINSEILYLILKFFKS